MLPSEHSDILYVLLMGPGAPRADYAAYRADRSRQLVLRCHAAKAARPNARFIVGIGLDGPAQRGSSEDLVYLDTWGWSNADLARAAALRADLGYFLEGVMVEQRVDAAEYPGAGG